LAIELKQQTDTSTVLAASDELTIYTVLEQKQQFFEFLKSGKELQIDLAGVKEIDSAGIQLLMLLKQEADLRNIKLSLIQHSKAIVDVFELLNLSKHFGDPIVFSADWKS